MKNLLRESGRSILYFAILLTALQIFGQAGGKPVQLAVARYSDAPHTSLVHEYVITAVNTSSQPVTLKIKAENTTCHNKNSVSLEREVFWSAESTTGSITGTSTQLVIPANGTAEFTVRTRRPLNTALNSWNCVLVQAWNNNQQVVSNDIVIESFIPDPADFR